MKNVKILDCTLRDGGYYTNWNYDKNLVNDYLNCMNDLNIDFVEIGLKGSSKDKDFGSFAYTKVNTYLLCNGQQEKLIL